ncbi:diguanylate cyclase [Herbivorax sp. ANBcel31]|uniref:sensor domain-containing diguanylate cyclase n=1 Tax=Herbivorax sp. ANBcel31 TaxID=3069754 RepID=UPI0027B020FD|nr:diguanylate cyclase [Herbivorax sp. ANBcel31]MDQ2085025.1 diguanylate cyclase [Herbivorax sp. ANBcel31]
MRKIDKYEKMYVNFTWIFIIIALLRMVIIKYGFQCENVLETSNLVAIIFLSIASITNICKICFIKKNIFQGKHTYYVVRLLEIMFVLFAVIVIGFEKWAYILLVFSILITTLEKGKRKAQFFLICSLAFAGVFQGVKVYSEYELLNINIFCCFSTIIFLHIVLLMFSELCGKIYEDNYESEQQNKRLFAELASRYEQLEEAQKEIQNQNDKLKDTNYKVEDTNKKLMESLAELYTVQQIAQAISSIFDIKELLQHVNDIIIGVMGVNNSTILIYDENKKKLKVHTTNIRNKQELITINDNVNCNILMETLGNGDSIIENFVDSKEFPFIENRDINSLICIPLLTKTKKFGLVLIEHKLANAFDDNNLRLMNIIGRQVGIAMENAELYQKMHELATIDNLTKVYNRLSFQEKLKDEFEIAKKNNYPLSLAIFDIDHFKKFNDTYGHLFGDKVLKHIASLIKNSLRSGDLIARYGGEEFVIVLPKTDISRAVEKVENLRKKLEQTTIKDELVSASVTVSFGVSCYPEFAQTESDLLKTADNALYDAKESGRNCVKVASLEE